MTINEMNPPENYSIQKREEYQELIKTQKSEGDKHCPRCNSIGEIFYDYSIKNMDRYMIFWKRNGVVFAKDSLVKDSDLEDSNFWCGYCQYQNRRII